MATLIVKPGNTQGYIIQWYDGRQRRSLYLGGRRYTLKTAERLKEVIETLVHCRYNNILILDKATIAWIQQSHETIRDKLAKAGLITPQTRYTCKQLWDTFIERKTDVKAKTINIYRDAEKKFFSYFKEDEPIEAVTHNRLVLWKAELLKHYSAVSTAIYIKQMKTVFHWAVESKWLSDNPVVRLPNGSSVNRSRDRLITMDEYDKMLACCPDKEWRRVIALSRIGGIRCPSELFLLKWDDIHWEKNRFYVTSPKTDRHAGKASRTVPLFRRLRQELEDADDKTGNVVNITQQALYYRLRKITTAAGMGEIERPFDNMRMSRSNEVLAQWGPMKESLWIGHSQETMRKHYLMLNDNDYSDASGETGC